MFSTFKYTTWYGAQPDLSLKGRNLVILKELVRLCNPSWTVETDYTHLGVLSIRSGAAVEHYPLLELLLYKIPPVLFNNHKYYCNRVARNMVRETHPIPTLYAHVADYYKRVRKVELKHVTQL